MQSENKLPHNRDRKIGKKSVEQLKSENLRRQMKTLVGKLNRMATCFGIDIYMHSRCKAKLEIYAF